MTDPSASPFTHGVASFDPLADRVLLWTRAPGAGRVAWHVSRTVDAGEVVAEGEADVPSDADGCVTVDVAGLEPATTYHYWFSVDGVLSPIGRTRTLPSGPTTWARLALVCCADPSLGPLRVYRAAAEDELDLVLHLGDYIYEEAKGDRPMEPDHTCATLEDYRLRLASTRRSPDLQALHLRHPMVFVWDDHDVADNAWRHGAKEHDPEEHGPWEDRLAAAARARQEWLPARLREPQDQLSMWRSFSLGDLAEVVVLDTRIPGRDQQAGDEGAKPLEDPDRSLLGPAQRRWAHERIRDTTRPWCLLASQVTVSALTLPVPAGAAVDKAMPSGYQVQNGEVLCSDEWDGYPAERTALVQAMADRGPGTVVLSGDVHSSWAMELAADEHGPAAAVEAVCPSVTSTPMAEQLPSGWEAVADSLAEEVPHQCWNDLEHRGYVRLDVRPEQVRADWFAVDPEDEAAVPRLLASWSSPHGRPPRWEEATPSLPVGAEADEVRRPGVALGALPAPEPPVDRSSPAARVGLAVAAGAVAAAALAWWWRKNRSA